MMKPVRNILILLLVIALLGGGIYLVNQYEPASDQETAPSLAPTITLFKTEKDSIVSVTVTRPEETYTLTKKGSSWVVNGDASVLISQSRVDTLLYDCANIVAREMLEASAQNLAQYGLEQPGRSVRIEQADGSVTTVLIGNASLENSVCYLMLEGSRDVYTKSASGCDSLAAPLSKLLDTSVYSMTAEDIGSITMSRTGAETVVLERVNMAAAGEEPAYQWKMTAPLIKTGNEYTINDTLLTNILAQSAVSVIPVPEAGVDYGFDNPQATYSITSLDKTRSYAVTVGKAEGENTYIRLQGNQTVYQVETAKLDFLKLGYLDLADKLVHIENIADVTQVQLSGLGRDYTMTITGEEDSAAYAVNGKTVTEDRFKTAYQAVLSLTLDDFIKDVHTGSPDFTIRYTKKDGSSTQVECVPYDDRNYVVLVNGEGNLLVRKKQVDNMLSLVEKVYSE